MDVIITSTDFSVTEHYDFVRAAAPHAGAVVMFVGLVRDFVSAQNYQQAGLVEVETAANIDYLELEHYPGMTEALCQDIVEQARERFSLDAVRVVHRVGKIAASEQIVLVVAASKHREDAFNGAQFVMDYLKTQATFWKKEVGTSGEQWLGLKQTDCDAAKRWGEPSDANNTHGNAHPNSQGTS
ncbi:molybdenum cofactor biosynthesis protein MoaE [Arenicella xantha]|uniref:Molybdopterin synthase catalytic subunit n=1 Tax=Arenicella xantha TaxID=644221 RepID=A0A395JN34_9GAMM|nr:molybdenum cofactor biosynthesis protein MoaE [Arenicella xantha]RBP52703.1 molybdopterin synthase subunit MoaE [Arenicella xantha]